MLRPDPSQIVWKCPSATVFVETSAPPQNRSTRLVSPRSPELFASTPLARIERETTPRLERLQTLQVVAELAGAFLLPAYAVFYRSLCYALAAFAYLNVLRLMYYARGCADHRKAWSALWRWCRPISGIPGVATAVDAYWQWFVALRVIPTANE